MILSMLAAVVLMADATTAFDPAASAAAPSLPAAAADAKPAKEKLICRNEANLGTRLPTKKCRTAAQMEAQKAEDRAALEQQQRMTPGPVSR
jgi:hypothetical protein